MTPLNRVEYIFCDTERRKRTTTKQYIIKGHTYSHFRVALKLQLPSIPWYKTHQIPTLNTLSYCYAASFAESLEARCQVDNEDVVGAAPTGDAPTTSQWSTIVLPPKVRLILEVLRYTS